MQYWLMKSEPEVFGIDDLKNLKTDHWDGVRNYQARNFMKTMQKGDLIFFYHSNCTPPGIAGIMQVSREAYPDFTAHDPSSKYFDPKSSEENPRWFMVDVKFKKKFKNIISLETLKQHEELTELPLVRRGNRLSVMPVPEECWHFINSQLT